MRIYQIKNGVGMRAKSYVFINEENPQDKQELDDESMQEFLIHHSDVEGVLYHVQMPRIKITYSYLTGEVKLIDTEQKNNINMDFSNAFRPQCAQVAEAIRRLSKLELLAELYKMDDKSICELIKQRHLGVDPGSGKIRANTAEIDLDMTLMQILKLGYSRTPGVIILRLLFISEKQASQTDVHKAIYNAFQDFKKLSSSVTHGLDQFNSRESIQLFRKLIDQHLNDDNVQSQFYKKGSG